MRPGNLISHFLYFTRPEFISFRQMCKELEKPKHQDYRNFLRIKGSKVPSHSALSRFRKQLAMKKNEKQFAKLQSGFINQAKQMEGFLNLMIGSLDSAQSMPVLADLKKSALAKIPTSVNVLPVSPTRRQGRSAANKSKPKQIFCRIS
jgi:hypothetical protein